MTNLAALAQRLAHRFGGTTETARAVVDGVAAEIADPYLLVTVATGHYASTRPRQPRPDRAELARLAQQG